MGEKAVWLPRSLAPCGNEGMAGGQDGRTALLGSRRGERGRLGERKWTDGRGRGLVNGRTGRVAEARVCGVR